jgi:hypothetical protein
MAEQRPLVIKRFTFEFSVRPITCDVLVPEGMSEDDEGFEELLRNAASAIDVNDNADWEDAYEAEEEEKPSA